jgi:glycosyltransferase involved in cell wall biosynthesis
MRREPVHILYFSSFGHLRWGGQKSLYGLVSQLDRDLYRPHVVVPSEGELAQRLRELSVEVIVHELPEIALDRAADDIGSFRFLLDVVERYGIDVLHTDGPRNTFFAGMAAKKKGLPLVWHIRAFDRDRYDRLLYGLSSRLIFVADCLRERFKWVRDDGKWITIYNGIDPGEFQRVNNGEKLRDLLGIGRDELLIVSVGRIEPLKGQIHLVSACGRIGESLPEFRLLLVGNTTDQAYRQDCEAMASAQGIARQVIFTGERDDIAGILGEADIFVLPSLYEAFPRAVIEAMGVGLPVIVTNAGGCAEAVEEGLSGFVVPAGDPEAIANRILQLGKDRELRHRMGDQGRQRAKTLFDIRENARKTERLYHEILR